MGTSTSPLRPDPERDWWSLAEWAKLYGFSRNGAHAMANRGEIPGAIKFGARWRVSKPAFLRHFHGADNTQFPPASQGAA